jgi:geranylgeranyl pyrophosphate synthase
MKKLETVHSTNQMLLSVALGQDMDILVPTDETGYWRVVENKSASFFGTALLLGALLGGATEKIANRVKLFGDLYGEMIQIHDDLNDAMMVPAGPDWIQRRAPLPILFTKTVDHPARKRFLELYENIAQPDALEEAQQILIQCGAVSYCVDQLLHRHQAIQKILENTQLANQQLLNNLANEIINPVWKMFNLVDMQPVSPLPTRLD